MKKNLVLAKKQANKDINFFLNKIENEENPYKFVLDEEVFFII